MPDKNFKIWGVSFSLIGDLIVGLPQLTYFEKKYPGSYKYWGIHKKMSHAAPLFYNHPLIDRIKITSSYLSYFQSGYIYHYAFAMLGGLVIILTWFVYY